MPEDMCKPHYANVAPAMFTFQLLTTVRGKHCRCPIAPMGVAMEVLTSRAKAVFV